MTTKKMPDTGNNRGPERPATEQLREAVEREIATAKPEDWDDTDCTGDETPERPATEWPRQDQIPKNAMPPSPPRSAGRVWTLVHRSLSLGMVTEHFWNVEGEKPEKDAEPIRVVPEDELEAARAFGIGAIAVVQAERDRYKAALSLADKINWLDMGDYYDATSTEAVEAFRAALADAGKGEG